MTASRTIADTAIATRITGQAAAGYSVVVAAGVEEIRAAQRLRHRVFADEMGAVLRTPIAGLDVDEFDEFCDHLIVRDDQTGEVVGTYRMLPPHRPPRPAVSTPRRSSTWSRSPRCARGWSRRVAHASTRTTAAVP
jgi:putative hemolysin